MSHDSIVGTHHDLNVATLAGVTLQTTKDCLSARDGISALAASSYLLCHAAFVAGRLALIARAPRSAVQAALAQRHYDVAELFAFVCPARMAVPTPEGLARALALEPASNDIETMRLVVDELLARLANRFYPLPREAAETAAFLARTNWPWAKLVMQSLLAANPKLDVGTFATGLNVWDRIEDWEDDGQRPPGSHRGVEEEEAQSFLRSVLGRDAELRPAQMKYAAAATFAFSPRQRKLENNILLTEAGTGLGKTLGYLSPAWLWARRNHAPVWISTYTKNLQRQLEQETRRLVEEPEEQRRRVVIRKGRENYLCLLNMQEAFGRMTASNARSALLASLIARWARFSRDGDMVGGDFPSWLLSLFGDLQGLSDSRNLSPGSLGLTDRRGECIYSACPHFRKCFLERGQRAARKADIVIANHALVMNQAAIDHAIGEAVTEEEEAAPGGLNRLVFDEGHHLFDAADSAFSGHLTGVEMAELRRWLRGPETERRRGRGLLQRIESLISDDEPAQQITERILQAAHLLPSAGWSRRLQGGRPEGVAEEFLSLVRQQVHARADPGGSYGIETDCHPLVDGLRLAAEELRDGLARLQLPLLDLANRLAKKLDENADELSSADRGRLEAVSRSLRKRGELVVGGWISMLTHLLEDPDPQMIDWFSVEQSDGAEYDTGMHSHWIDPTKPLAVSVLREADGVVITSATLKDRPPDVPDDWSNAEMRTGAVHLPYPVRRASFDSPFPYASSTRIIVVNDVARDDMDQLAAAYRELFKASGGGALGLFTAISRLRAVHQRLSVPLAEAGLTLYAQHVDPMDTGTLVDMFRAEGDSCLLGTDAVRDGVDVPGTSLRLIVLDRVPWATPSILERARREVFGGQAYADMVVRLKLRQAFGRLIRREDDRGCFVVLDSRLASRFTTAFPPGVAIERMGLVEALERVAAFLPSSRQMRPEGLARK